MTRQMPFEPLPASVLFGLELRIHVVAGHGAVTSEYSVTPVNLS